MSQRTAGNPPKAPRQAAPSSAAAAASPATATAAAPPAFPTMLLVKVSLWFLGWYLCVQIQFGSIFLLVSALVGIFNNLSSEDGTTSKNGQPKMSAYSVFNTGAQRIAGSMDADQIEDQLRHKATKSKGIDLDIGSAATKAHPTRMSKAANQPCVCGSGKKYKNCCSLLTLNAKKEEAEWDDYEKEWM